MKHVQHFVKIGLAASCALYASHNDVEGDAEVAAPALNAVTDEDGWESKPFENFDTCVRVIDRGT
jgi:hypothetical protein